MPIQWTKNLRLGIPELDAQHLELDGFLALVHDAICEGRVPDVPAVLEGVRSCSSRHFACEEAHMAGLGYPALEEHRARHREFTEQLARFEEASMREGATTRLAIEIGNSLARWVREHQRYDLQFAAHVRETNRMAPGEMEP
ncbi:MAG TPA: hemerythrin domain-containing protein [Anaeromyxobacter sp.]|nr:hemerythrin domain-containing protein [Anaeromyxobacter sp.]